MSKKPTLPGLVAAIQEEARLACCNLCPACFSGDAPERDSDGRWWHKEYDEWDTEDDSGSGDRECDAQEVRELVGRISERVGLTVVVTLDSEHV